MTIYYHFTSNKLRDERDLPKIGEWLEHEGDVIMCESGLHASATPFDALQYAPGEMLHQVELGGIVQTDSDKVVARKRKIIASIDATALLRLFARKQALSVIHLWDCPAITREYLETGDESKRVAAGVAAWAAARDAAWDAAWVAARDAAWAAARAMFNSMVEEAFSSKVSQTCMAIIPTNSIATEGSPCGKPAVGNTEMCERHLAENGI